MFRSEDPGPKGCLAGKIVAVRLLRFARNDGRVDKVFRMKAAGFAAFICL